MCCLFGIIDYKQSLSKKQINRIISTLSVACEARGTDATGISYNTAEGSVYSKERYRHTECISTYRTEYMRSWDIPV